MKQSAWRLAAFCLVALGIAAPGRAQVARVFVSVNGNDLNVCSNVATPCRNYAAAITQVDESGEVIVLDSGAYDGLNITKSVTIRAPRGVVAHSNTPFSVDAPSKSVKLIGLSINPPFSVGVGGIEFFHGALLYLERCVLHNFYYGIRIHEGRAVIVDSVIRDLLNVAITADGGSHLVVLNSRVEGDHVDATDSIGDMRECVIEGGQYGATSASQISSGYALMTVDKCTLTGQIDAVAAFAGSGLGATANLVVARSTIDGCQSAAFTNGGTVYTYNNNQSHGNSSNTIGSIVINPQ